MSPFDESELEKPLDAQVKAETEISETRSWATKKLQKIGCVFMQKWEDVKACCGLKRE